MKDDLESAGYIIAYLLNGSLPWYKTKKVLSAMQMKKQGPEEDCDNEITRLISMRSASVICMNLDPEIQTFINYC